MKLIPTHKLNYPTRVYFDFLYGNAWHTLVHVVSDNIFEMIYVQGEKTTLREFKEYLASKKVPYLGNKPCK